MIKARWTRSYASIGPHARYHAMGVLNGRSRSKSSNVPDPRVPTEPEIVKKIFRIVSSPEERRAELLARIGMHRSARRFR